MKFKWTLKGEKVSKTSTWSLRACKDGKGTLSLPFQDPSPRIRLNAAEIIQPNGSHHNMIEGCPMLPSVTGTPSQRPWLLTKMGMFCLKKPLRDWKAGLWPPLRLSTKPVILDENPEARKMDSASALGTSRARTNPRPPDSQSLRCPLFPVFILASAGRSCGNFLPNLLFSI